MSLFPCCVMLYECGCTKCAENSENALLGKSESGCVNLLCSPVALSVHSFYAYFVKCAWVYTARTLNHTCCYPCLHMGVCNSCYLYKDSKFPNNDESLGFNGEDKGIIWKRAPEILPKTVLFQQDVEPTDVVQGNLSNCWLMSAFACMAEFPGLVDKVFINREKSTRGKYQVALFNAFADEWQIVTVDDYFPVRPAKNKNLPVIPAEPQPPAGAEEVQDGEEKKEGEPDMKAEENEFKPEYEFYGAQPKDNELWVPVLEKAFAKFRGSYENLVGGNTLWAFQCLTGDYCFSLEKAAEEEKEGVEPSPDLWSRFVLVNDVAPTDTTGVKLKKTGHTCRTNKLFDLMRTYDRSKALIAASMKTLNKDKEDKNGEEVDEEVGLIRGHAYSVIQAKKIGDFELLQLRNPWGRLEWKGDWGDDSELWEQHKNVADALHFERNANDGKFWMSIGDFARLFDNIDFCDRTVDYSDFHLDVHENPDSCIKHFCGPTQGCVEGCFGFWCKCEGIRNIYCGNQSKNTLKKAKKGRDDGFFT